MNKKNIAIAKAEAERFLRAVRAYNENPPELDFIGTKESGAVRRASMDLTRALAAMRKP